MRNEIINFRKIFINFDKITARINSCNVIIFIKIYIFNKTISKLIHLRKIIIIFSRSKISILMHYFDVSNNQNFLFESNKIFYLTIYVHMINIILNAMVLRNNFHKLIQILRNYCLDRFSKINYLNAFKINAIEKNNAHDLTIKHFKFIYLKKLIL